VIRKEEVIDQIREAFVATLYPGDGFLQGTFEGCEPYEEVGAFIGKTDWRALDSTMLDAHYDALSFFSEGGFRFFLPAYLIADLREELLTADPLFHLWHGFAIVSADVLVGPQTFRRGSGEERLLNPKRYGAMTWSDHACHRLSVFNSGGKKSNSDDSQEDFGGCSRNHSLDGNRGPGLSGSFRRPYCLQHENMAQSR
jgi:hypothetical protein